MRPTISQNNYRASRNLFHTSIHLSRPKIPEREKKSDALRWMFTTKTTPTPLLSPSCPNRRRVAYVPILVYRPAALIHPSSTVRTRPRTSHLLGNDYGNLYIVVMHRFTLLDRFLGHPANNGSERRIRPRPF